MTQYDKSPANLPNWTKLRCVICGTEFSDNGSHPLVCGKKDCVFKAAQIGWDNLKKQQGKTPGKGSGLIYHEDGTDGLIS